MINILIPLAGNSRFYDEAELSYPKPLFEIAGLPMIQRAISTFDTIKEDKRFIFVIKKHHASKFHFENTLKLLTDGNCDIVEQNADTQGAICSCLLGLNYINNNDPLIISNGDQIILEDLQKSLITFRSQNADAGVLYFQSVHPQWSYIKLDEHHIGLEVAEKNPISRNSIAGFYYFSKGCLFVNAAQESIYKDNRINNLFFISSTLNEIILKGKKVFGIQIEQHNYHSFYSLDRVRNFEDFLKTNQQRDNK